MLKSYAFELLHMCYFVFGLFWFLVKRKKQQTSSSWSTPKCTHTLAQTLRQLNQCSKGRQSPCCVYLGTVCWLKVRRAISTAQWGPFTGCPHNVVWVLSPVCFYAFWKQSETLILVLECLFCISAFIVH